MCNYFSYMRISTEIERRKQKYSRQEYKISRFAKQNNIEILLDFKEDVSGTVSFHNRIEWNKLEKIIRPDDYIIFTDISRFSRKADEGYDKYMELLEKGINMIFIDTPTVNSEFIHQMQNTSAKLSFSQKIYADQMTKVIIATELDRAEKEREEISKRIKDGLAASKKKSGRPAGHLDKMTDALRDDIKTYLTDRSIKQVDLMKKHKISRNTLKKYAKLYKEENHID